MFRSTAASVDRAEQADRLGVQVAAAQLFEQAVVKGVPDGREPVGDGAGIVFRGVHEVCPFVADDPPMLVI